MPITLLDMILLAVMLVSALLAMVRGFMREILSIASWAAAAIVTIYAYPRLKPVIQQYLTNDIVASAATIGVAFLGTLLVVSIVTIKISDTVLDSRVGALDRTLGFLFGLGRGLIIVVVAFMFLDWLVPAKSQPKWATDAKSRYVLQGTGEWLVSMSPDLEALWAKYKRQRGIEAEPQDAPPGRSNLEFGERLAANHARPR